ncbi:hypothetical protein [Bacillus weihaiensis]|uniref:hypothetical protein n=1 Tax=Bacillus weihaiensis TaxID=1547283 RepID=UPI0023555351|nr:hypothetical protein [Bacillus weihaiensis]
MIVVIGTGVLFVGMTVAEKKGWLDLDFEKVEAVVKIGMSAGIAGGLLYFISKLPMMFL